MSDTEAASTSKTEKKPDDMRVMFPGVEVSIELPDGPMMVTVFPVGIQQMKKFVTAIAGAVGIIRGMDLKKDGSTQDHLKQMLPHLIPIVLNDLFGLVQECTVGVDLDTLPHWLVPPIVEAWIIESFGDEKKIRPWIQMFENLTEKMTGQKTEIWATLSNTLSQPGIP